MTQIKHACHNQPREMSDSDSSAISEGARAARDRLAPKTQADYASAIHGLKQFAFDNREQYSDCISGDNIVLPVPLICNSW